MKKRFSLAFWHRSHAGRRMAALLISTFLMVFCIAIFDQVNFGLDPCSTFSMGLSGLTGLSFGTCQFLLNLVLFIPVVLLDPSLIGIGTVANMVLVGYTADLFLLLLRPVLSPASPFGLRLLLLAAAMCIFLPAVAFYIVIDLGIAPYDAGAQLLSTAVRRFPYRIVRVVWDVSFLVLGWLMGSTVGLTTLAISLLIGPAVGVLRPRIEPLFE